MTDENPISCLPRHYAQWVKEQRKKRGDPDWDRPVESTPRTPVKPTRTPKAKEDRAYTNKKGWRP